MASEFWQFRAKRKPYLDRTRPQYVLKLILISTLRSSGYSLSSSRTRNTNILNCAWRTCCCRRIELRRSRNARAKNLFLLQFLYTNYLEVHWDALSTKLYVWSGVLRVASDSDVARYRTVTAQQAFREPSFKVQRVFSSFAKTNLETKHAHSKATTP